MYYDYFGFRYPPFKITPDTSLFFPGGNRGTILEALGYAIRNGEGIVKVVGEVGSGKTMLCRMLEIELPANIEIVYLANPRLSPDNILQAIAFELKLQVGDEDNRLLVMQCLHDYLLERHAENKQVVVFIEEAQSMPLATLEEIRLLSNLETNQHKLLQIVLFGQPELDDMLAKPQIRQLNERITYHFNLEPLRQAEIRDYLNARQRSCGFRGRTLFTGGAIRLVTRYSRGLLRRVNILADKALLAAYADNSRRVGKRQVMAAVRDSGFRPAWRDYLWPAAALVMLLSAVILYQRIDGSWSWPQLDSIGAMTVEAEEKGHITTDPAPADQAPTVPARPRESQPTPVINSEPLDTSHVWASYDGLWMGEGRGAEEEGRRAGYNTVDSPEIKSIETSREKDDFASMMPIYMHKMPPEEVWLDAPDVPGTTCDRCIAIIYRPLQVVEKM